MQHYSTVKTTESFAVHSFQLVGIDHSPFESLFDLPDEELLRMGAKRCRATAHPGFPCRISLKDAEVGEELLLLPYIHQPALSPYHASGPIYIRRGARRTVLGVAEVPSYVSSRLMSVRAYDAAHMMIDASVCDGGVAGTEIERLFDNPLVAYIHLHNAKRGCFSCQVNRA